MIALFQFPWSPFCIVQRRILEFSGVPFGICDIPNTERSAIWKLTHERYYQVPVIRDGRTVVFELDEDSQVIAKYLDAKLNLGLFPWDLEGVQSILWRWIENEVEGLCFRLNDVYYEEFLPKAERMAFIRHKERKFGRGCLEQWRVGQNDLLARLEQKLMPFEEMLLHRPFLLEARPRFVDFDLYGMLANFLYSGHYRIPKAHNHLRGWYRRMTHVRLENFAREKELHSRHQRPAARPEQPPGVRGKQRPAAH